ncbi:hypothetical protein [Bradyrhizobium sp. Arg816]|uniref:hypothetical protein n=1 Tax=Bradyrhizobium sp. Arg816 TaxID=2998491 RepID=UPI00249F8651|nr:hypothetical protein [Bradyrhizobium sp. Arg816]MDI3562465.1 hypothetical protein [Bradyrhizobium sp. Arg816]
MSSEKPGFVDSLLAAAKDNPLAAALVGGGLLWLITGDEKMRTAAKSFTAAMAPAKDLGAKAAQSAASVFETSPPTAPDLDDEAHETAGAMRKAAGAASDAVSNTAEKVKGRLNDGIASAQETLSGIADSSAGKQTYEKARSSLAGAFERQPLLLGAVGIAIGSAVAGAFRVTALESETMGRLSDDVKNDFGRRTQALAQSLREASDTVRAEFTDLGDEALDRVRQTGMDAVDAAKGAAKL